jgi:hypothetical protein
VCNAKRAGTDTLIAETTPGGCADGCKPSESTDSAYEFGE